MMGAAMSGRGADIRGSGRGMEGMSGMMGSMMGARGMNGTDAKKNVTTLTRTDFLIQFVWSPKPDEIPKDPEELKTKLEEMRTQLFEAQKGAVVTLPDEKTIEAASLKQSKALDSALQQAVQQSTGTDPAAPAAPTTPTPPSTPETPKK